MNVALTVHEAQFILDMLNGNIMLHIYTVERIAELTKSIKKKLGVAI